MVDEKLPVNEAGGAGIALKWDRRWRDAGQDADWSRLQPVQVLQENAHLLPTDGKALELACGLGANAQFLARRGLTVSAWDISTVAIAGLAALAAAEALPLQAEVRDVVAEPPAADSFDVIVVSHYLERALAPILVRALRPGGLLFYQTFTVARVSDQGPRNPAFRLRPTELLQLFADLELLVYREEGRVGDTRQGFRDEAMLVGMKPLR